MMQPLSSPRSGEAPILLAMIPLHRDPDVVLSRQKARQLGQMLRFDSQDQTRIATAASEIAREGLQSGTAATLNLCVDITAGLLLIQLQTAASASQHASTASFPSREGIIAARRIMTHFAVEQLADATLWNFGRALPAGLAAVDVAALAQLAESSAHAPPHDLYQEFQAQNKELLDSLQELGRQQIELAKVNQELEETNRGVVALYAELEEQAISLRRTNEQKTRFFSSVSHELRTPVTSILSLSQILLDRLDGELTPEQDRQVSLIRRCGQNLLEWVNDLLDLARVDAGRMNLRLSEFTVRDLLTSLRGIMRPLVTSGAVSLVVEDAQDAGSTVMYSDEGKLSQILRNLVSNALKFTEQGEVRVSVARSSPPDNSICFEVRDTGIGIAASDQERIFDEFVQVESPLQRKARGTGLGLPLSRRLASLLGGSIRVSSAVGAGSTFQLVLPQRLSLASRSDNNLPESDPGPATSRAAAQARSMILIIDDDEACRYLLKQVLLKFNVDVHEAKNGFEGLNLAEELVPHAIFLDLAMPDLDGYEVLDSLKNTPGTRDIPVVVYTSGVRELAHEPRLTEQAVAIVLKPAGDRGPPVQQIQEVLEQAGIIDHPANRGVS